MILLLYSLNLAIAGANFPEKIYLGFIDIYGLLGTNESSTAVIELATRRLAKEGVIADGTIQVVTAYVPFFCNGYRETEEYLDLVFNKSITGLIGPPCSSSGVTIGRLGVSYNMLMVGYLTTSPVFADKNIYKTFARTTITSMSQMYLAIIKIMKMFNWKRLAIISIPGDFLSDLFTQNLLGTLDKNDIDVSAKIYYDREKPELEKYLQKIREEARIVLVLLDWNWVSSTDLMVAARSHHMTGYDYIWIQPQFNPFGFTFNSEFDDNQLSPFNATILVQPEAYSTVTLNRFFDEVESLHDEMFPQLQGTYERIHHHASLYDATYTFGLLLNETVDAGIDYRDGGGLMNLLKWKRIDNGSTSPIIFDGDGERAPTYVIHSLDSTNQWHRVMKMERIANLTRGLYDFSVEREMNVPWLTNPPLDRPKCGFQGEFCVEKPSNTNIYIYIGVALAVFLIVIGLVYWANRNYYEKQLMSQSWKLSSHKLQRNQPMIFGSSKTFDEISQEIQVVSENGRFASALCTYDKNPVYINCYLKLHSFNLNRNQLESLMELRNMTHPNVNKFMGLIMDDSSQLIVVWSLNHVRTLRDTLQIKDMALDNDFLSSFQRGLMQGIKYIHGSRMQCHGWLTSDTCLVDSRFVVRLSQFGMTSILDPLIKQSVISSQYPHHDLLHFPPEVLGELNSSSSYPGSTKADIYNLGMILYQILTRMELFEQEIYDDFQSLVSQILDKSRPHRPGFPADLSKEWMGVVQIIRQCWEFDPKKRPTLEMVYSEVRKATKSYAGNLMEKMVDRMEKYANNLEKIVQDRTTEVEVEKEKALQLLQNMLPKSVVDRLQAGLTIEPESFDEATILFTDIVNFTQISARQPIISIVTLLNKMFGSFDEMIDRLDVYKVETIGDAYMVVSGVPHRNTHHAKEIVYLALNIRDMVMNFVAPFDEPISIRLGVHSGAVAAGVVGVKMPRYCLFGDTVNTASRMESSAIPMKVHISNECKDIINEYPEFRITLRGNIEVKGKGTQTTYFVEHNKLHSIPKVMDMLPGINEVQ